MPDIAAPTAAPMTLIYAAVARKADAQQNPVAPTGVFIAGYVAVWTLFSLATTAAQWALDQDALLSLMMVATSPAFGAALLVAAGIYQLTPLKLPVSNTVERRPISWRGTGDPGREVPCG